MSYKTLRKRFYEYITSENINLTVDVDLNDFVDDLSIVTKEWIEEVELSKESYEAKNELIMLAREP